MSDSRRVDLPMPLPSHSINPGDIIVGANAELSDSAGLIMPFLSPRLTVEGS